MATSSPAVGKKRTAEELMAAEDEQQLVTTDILCNKIIFVVEIVNYCHQVQ